MFCLLKIYGGIPENQGSEAFCFTKKGFKRVLGAFCSGGADLSLVFDNGNKVVLHGFEFVKNSDCPPNKRLFIFQEPAEAGLIYGVVSSQTGKGVSVYLILE